MGGHRILVVEDDPRNQRLFHDLLEFAGYEVAQAYTIDEGRMQLKQGAPALVIMDIRVPGGGGELFMREIRQMPDLKDIPIVAVTAFAMSGDRQRFLSAGFDGYLSKPVDARTFTSTIAVYLEGGVNHER